jgi:hypothetical protein
MERRQLIAGILAGFAGCVSNQEDSPTDTPTPTPSQAPTSEPTLTPEPTRTSESTPTPPSSIYQLMNEPNYAHLVTLENSGNETHPVTIRVTHVDSGAVIFNESKRIDPGEQIEVFDFRTVEEQYNGRVETFEIRAESGDNSNRMNMSTNVCQGPPHIDITDDGIKIAYALC